MNVPEYLPENPRPQAGVRWWPLLLILAAGGARLVQIWFFKDFERQFKFDSTWRTLTLVLPLAALWFFFFSRFSWGTRLRAFATLLILGMLAVAMVRFRGINGDRVPVLEWRWSMSAPGMIRTAGSSMSPTNSAPKPPPGAADFPQFQGPDRTATLAGPNLATNWAAQAPELLWRKPVGEGWSGFAVAGNFAVSMEQSGDSETIFAARLADGERLWARQYPASYANSQSGNGPRSTPTIRGNRIYTSGATGILTCLELETGNVMWAVDLMKEHGAKIPEWGYSASPLVVDGLVWLPVGGTNRSLVAHDALTGRFRFGGGNSAAAYASPVPATLGGRAQILNFNDGGVSGHDAANGRLLWEQPVPPAPHVAAPLAVGPNQLVVSTGYGKGTFLIEVRVDAAGTWTAREVWRTIRLKSKFANLLARGDTLYGLDDGAMVGIDLGTGALRWKDRRYGHGQLLQVGQEMMVSAENGEMILIDARPDGMSELSRFRVLNDKTWNPPALAGNLLLVRNDREAACFRMPTR